ncbi:hypothetical protein [Rubellimicrobium roseum]|uniref:Uncharacterized protein n=1 Tax=Rubellimicrobium roseum TaxID=687525 RepID=A0A5C4N7L9_9RHOB|nr:hypothetical protein [Rubellimicrobium roseum]TNC63544.1 hypothetical protein FHG71_19365 [Rubellimicrobium roseum]
MIRQPLYVIVPGLLLALGAGGMMAYRQFVAEPPPAAAPAGPVAGLAAAAAAASSLIEAAPFEAVRNLAPTATPVEGAPAPASEPPAEPLEPAPEAEGAEETRKPPAVRHGAEGLGGSGDFSCAIEAGVRRCRSGD